jgi:hypothetical protein
VPAVGVGAAGGCVGWWCGRHGVPVPGHSPGCTGFLLSRTAAPPAAAAPAHKRLRNVLWWQLRACQRPARVLAACCRRPDRWPCGTSILRLERLAAFGTVVADACCFAGGGVSAAGCGAAAHGALSAEALPAAPASQLVTSSIRAASPGARGRSSAARLAGVRGADGRSAVRNGRLAGV